MGSRTNAGGTKQNKYLFQFDKDKSIFNSLRGTLNELSTDLDPTTPKNVNNTTAEVLEGWMEGDGNIQEIIQHGSGIPYYSSMIGDLLINPSTVSVLTFKKMMETDAIIASSLDYNISSVVNSIGEYVHEDKEIQEAIRFTFKNLKRGFNNLVRDMATGFGFGFSILSLWWDYSEKLGGNTIVDAIPLPQSTIQLRSDITGYLHEYGVGQYVYNAGYQNIASANSMGWFGGYGTNYATQGGGGGFEQGNCYGGTGYGFDRAAAGGDLDYPFRINYYAPVGLVWLHESNTLIYSNYGTTAQMNPYGRSILRPIYTLWLQKVALQQFKMVALNRRSFPLLVVYCNALIPVIKQDATSDTPTGTPIDALEDAQNNFSDLNSMSTIMLNGMKGETYEVEKIDVDGNIDILAKIEDDINSQMQQALGVPDTATGGKKEGGSYALAAMHGQSNSRFVASRRQDILDCLIRQFVKPIIRQLFTETQHKGDFGCFEDEQLSVDERIKNATLHQTSIGNGVISPQIKSQHQQMLSEIGFSALTEEEQTEFEKIYKEQQEMEASNDKRDLLDSTDKPYTHQESDAP